MNNDENFILFCKNLGNKIKIKRKQRHISIEELSNITGIRVEYLKKIELGEAKGVLIEEHLSKIAKVIKVKLADLFDN